VRQQPKIIVSQHRLQPPVDLGAQLPIFDRNGDLVGLGQRHEHDEIEAGESLADPAEQPPVRQPLETLAGADDVEIGEESSGERSKMTLRPCASSRISLQLAFSCSSRSAMVGPSAKGMPFCASSQ
jgi:hypothetical protein